MRAFRKWNVSVAGYAKAILNIPLAAGWALLLIQASIAVTTKHQRMVLISSQICGNDSAMKISQ